MTAANEDHATDVEQLLHDTLSARAATMTDAPAFAGPPAPHRRWPALAAAAAVVALAGGLVAVRGHDDHPSASDGTTHACRTSLPAPWRAAERAAPDTVDGHPTVPLTVAADGSVIVTWRDGNNGQTVGVTGRGGATRPLHTFAAGQAVVSADTDGRSLVVNLGPADDLERSGVDDIAVVNLRTSNVVHVLRAADIAHGTVVSSKYGAVIQDGVVYWAAGARIMSASGGPIFGYDVDDGRTRAIAQVGNTAADVLRTSAGVVWPGGSVPGPALPRDVPRRPYASNDPVRTDGTSFAWTPDADPRSVDWADRDGRTRSVRIDLPHTTAARVYGVVGPFVLVTPEYLPATGNAAVLVLDTRTGAIADLGQAVDAGATGRDTIALTAGGGTVRLDTSRLPGLTC